MFAYLIVELNFKNSEIKKQLFGVILISSNSVFIVKYI